MLPQLSRAISSKVALHLKLFVEHYVGSKDRCRLHFVFCSILYSGLTILVTSSHSGRHLIQYGQFLLIIILLYANRVCIGDYTHVIL